MDNDIPASVTGGSAIDETARLISSDKVEGTAVFNRQDRRLGSVHNFMVDQVTGQDWRRFSRRVGSFSISVGQPPPGRRTAPDNEPGSARSFNPRPMVLRATPVARDAALIPPESPSPKFLAASRHAIR